MRPIVLKNSTEACVKVEPGLEKSVRMFIQCLNSDEQICQALGQQLWAKDERPEQPAALPRNSNLYLSNWYSKSGWKPERQRRVCASLLHCERSLRPFIRDCKTGSEENKGKYFSRIKKAYDEGTKKEGKRKAQG